MKKIFFKVTLVVVPALMILWGVDLLYRKLYQLEYHLPAHVLPNPPITEKYQLVKVGNSHAQDGITFQGYKLRSLDLSSVAQKYEIDLAQLKQHAAEIEEGAVIIIPVTPISFSHTAVNSLKGLQSNYYGHISPFFIPHLNWGDYVESEFFPFIRAGYFLRRKNTEQIRERIAKEEKWAEPTPSPTSSPSAATQLQPTTTAAKPNTTTSITESSPTSASLPPTSSSTKKLAVHPDQYYYNVEAIKTQLASPAALPAIDFVIPKYMDNIPFTYNKWNFTDEFSREFFAQNRRDLSNLIQYSLKRHWRPVLITIPITADLEKALAANYKQEYIYDNLQHTELQGVEYLDFSNDARLKTQNAFFSNSDHLNRNGKAIFSYLLLQTLIEKGYLTPAADGYNYGPLYQ